MGMNCSEADAIMYAFVDGELSGSDRTAYESHLISCDSCARATRLQSRFKAALRGHLPRPEVPEGLRQRLHGALEAEPTVRRQWPWQAYPRIFTVAIAAAAAVCCWWQARGAAPRPPCSSRPVHLPPRRAARCAFTELRRGHRLVSRQARLHHAAASRRSDRALCQGGRLVNVRERFGAYVVYQAPAGHRLGLMVFPADDDLAFGRRRRTLGGRDVYVGSSRGVSTAAYHGQDGLTYVFTADLDEDALAHWVETVYLQRR